LIAALVERKRAHGKRFKQGSIVVESVHGRNRHPRFHTHFLQLVPSWLNLVERFFGELTSEVVREGSFQSLRQLVRTIGSYLVERNRNPKKYVWRASGLKILDKIKRARAAIATAAVIST
jgi:hypothetical protein